MSNELLLSHRSRKRSRESERIIRPKTQRRNEIGNNNACDALDLVSLFHGLTLFDERIERINVKDMFCQEFIDRIGKLYKPLVMELQDHQNVISTNEKIDRIGTSNKLECDGEYFRTVKDDCPLYIFNRGFREYQKSKKLMIEYEITSYFQDNMLKYCFEEFGLPFLNIEDIVTGLAIIYLGKTFSYNENLKSTLCRYINSVSTNTANAMSCDEESDYDSDICSDNYNTQKRKRRKIMSDLSTQFPY